MLFVLLNVSISEQYQLQEIKYPEMWHRQTYVLQLQIVQRFILYSLLTFTGLECEPAD